MLHLQERNIYTTGNEHFVHEIRFQKYIPLDFTADQGPLIIPYQMAAFWWSVYDDADGNNQSVQIAKALNNVCWGVTWMEGEITTEVYTVTRERLIQQGSTNYKTYDFETSQNLFMGLVDREQVTVTLTSAKQLAPNAYHSTIIKSLFDDQNDRITKIEIPQRMMHTFKVKFSQPPHNYTFQPVDLSDVNNISYHIPGPQCLAEDNLSTIGQWWGDTELYDQVLDSGSGYSNQFFWKRRSYPLLMYGQPQVPDETGNMKFRYMIRFSTKLTLKYHFYPTYYLTTDTFLKRQAIPLPKWQTTDSVPKGTIAAFSCIPYESKA